MPLYDYSDGTHVTESRQGVDVESIPCPRCSRTAVRVQVYQDQFMQAETGPKGGKKNDVPPSDIRLGQDVSEFQEANEEIAYHYEKAGKKPPDLMKRARRKARALGAPIA